MASYSKILFIIIPGLLLGAPGCLGDKSDDSAWRPEEEVILEDVEWISQKNPFGRSNNCGPTALEMAWAYLEGETPTLDPGVYETILWMDENIPSYGGVRTDHRGSPSTRSELADTSFGYLHLQAAVFGTDGESIGGLEGLYRELMEGRPVLITTWAQTRWVEDDVDQEVMTNDDVRHYMVLVGLTPTHVVFHDPGQDLVDYGAYRYFTAESFLAEGWDRNGGVRFPE